MWPSDFIWAVFWIPAVISSLLRFRLPSSDYGLSSGELLAGQSSAVSYLYVDVYQQNDLPFSIENVLSFFVWYPCIIMKPGYSNVRDKMTFYSTCNYDDIISLELSRFGNARHWTAIAKFCRPTQNDLHQLRNLTDFNLMWQGINHTVKGTERENTNFITELDAQLLLYQPGWKFDKIRAMYPEIIKNSYPTLLSLHSGKCACLNETTTKQLEIWREACYESASSMKAVTVLMLTFSLLPFIVTKYIFCWHN